MSQDEKPLVYQGLWGEVVAWLAICGMCIALPVAWPYVRTLDLIQQRRLLRRLKAARSPAFVSPRDAHAAQQLWPSAWEQWCRRCEARGHRRPS